MNKIFTTAKPNWLPSKYSPICYVIPLTNLQAGVFLFLTLIKVGNWLAGGTQPDLFDARKCVSAVLCLVTTYALRASTRWHVDQLNVTHGSLMGYVALARLYDNREAKQAVHATFGAMAYEFAKLSKYKLCLQSDEIRTIRTIWEYCRSIESLHQQPAALDASRHLTNTDG